VSSQQISPTARELLDSYRMRNMGHRDHSTTTYTAEHLAARVEAVLALQRFEGEDSEGANSYNEALDEVRRILDGGKP